MTDEEVSDEAKRLANIHLANRAEEDLYNWHPTFMGWAIEGCI